MPRMRILFWKYRWRNELSQGCSSRDITMRQKIASSAVKRVTPRAAHLGGITVADQHPGGGQAVRCSFPGRVATFFFSMSHDA